MSSLLQELEANGTLELYPDKRFHRWVVTREMVKKRPEVRLLVLLEAARQSKDAKERRALVAEAAKVLAPLDPWWRGSSSYLAFVRDVAPIEPKLAQQVLDRMLRVCLKAPLAKDVQRLPLAQCYRDYRAAELTRFAVLAKTVGLDASGFTDKLEKLIRAAKAPYQGNVGTVIVGLHYAGHDVKPLLAWAESVVDAAPELDDKGRAWRVNVAASFAAVALFAGDSKAMERFLKKTTPSNVKRVRKVAALKGPKRDEQLKSLLYLNWTHFKNEVSSRPERFIPVE